jgi:hypothetical protein
VLSVHSTSPSSAGAPSRTAAAEARDYELPRSLAIYPPSVVNISGHVLFAVASSRIAQLLSRFHLSLWVSIAASHVTQRMVVRPFLPDLFPGAATLPCRPWDLAHLPSIAIPSRTSYSRSCFTGRHMVRVSPDPLKCEQPRKDTHFLVKTYFFGHPHLFFNKMKCTNL